jgi:hypothetical protein
MIEWKMIPASSFHQFFEGLALGARVALLDFASRWTPWLMGLAFTLITPIGINSERLTKIPALMLFKIPTDNNGALPFAEKFSCTPTPMAIPMGVIRVNARAGHRGLWASHSP